MNNNDAETHCWMFIDAQFNINVCLNWPDIDPCTTQPTTQKSWRVTKGRRDDFKIPCTWDATHQLKAPSVS